MVVNHWLRTTELDKENTLEHMVVNYQLKLENKL